MTRARDALAILGSTLALAAAPLDAVRAQVVRGTVTAGSPQRPLSGAVVIARDSAGATLARTLSDSSGSFRITAGRRVSSLRVTRIGYRPVDLPLAGFTGVIAMQPISVALSAVRVTGRAMCPDAGGREQVVQVWEQARDALLAAVVAREARPADATLLLYERVLDAGGRRVLSETRRSRKTRTSRPFVAAANASTFATLGYVREHGGDRVFFAPDADVLLDPTFADSHCFAVVRDDDRPGDLGLEFTPARERRGLVDVRGTLWLRRDDPRIEDVEFSYTELGGVTSARQAGGFLEFATLPNGVTLLSRWAIRMPRVVVRAQEGSSAGGIGIAGGSPRVTGVHETGGVVVNASWVDGSVFAPVIARIAGVVHRMPHDTPVPGAAVRLEATGATTTSDSNGRFVLSAPLSGRYTVVATDTTIPFTVPELIVTGEVLVAEGRDAALRLQLPGEAEVARAVCDLVDGGVRPPAGKKTGTIIGRVAVPGGSPMGMHVTATWLARITIGHGLVRTGETTISMELDTTGTFVLCDVVSDRKVRLTARRSQVLLVDTSLTVTEGAALTRVAITADLSSRARLAQQLAPVEVRESTTMSPRMRDFEERRRSGFGHFIDESAMRKSDGPIASLIPRHIAGVRVVFVDTKTYLALSRGGGRREVGQALAGGIPEPCWIDIYVDGIQQFGDTRDDPVDVSRIGTHTLAAAEFYAGGATLPPQFNRTSNNCGVLLLWSRER